MVSVSLEAVTKVYPNGVRALTDVTLHAEPGERVVVVGPSGCGKTTLLRLIAGLERPTHGTVRLDGRPVEQLPPAERGVGLVFQRPALYPHLTVRRNLAVGLQLAGTCPRDEIDRRVGETAELLGLASELDRYPRELSGGQQQRVALGRALVRRPRVLLLDEPFSSLDTPLRNELRRELHLLPRHFATTMFYVTHDQAEALALADRLAVLHGGVLQQAGRPDAVYDKPCNRVVAAALGWPPMNLLEGRLTADDAGLCLQGVGASLWLPAAGRNLASWQGRHLVLGVRPEDIALTDAPNGEDVVSLRMPVAWVEPLGFASLVTCSRGDWTVSALRTAALEVPPRGAELDLGFALGKVRWFDATGGQALAVPAAA